ncbi:ABC transporter permease [Meiothermus granaticius]|uniref:Glutathione transport system permease protein GsiC n=1 Tax=Meiothermus granaticius NBRC 107808 TaxID=1227551 RepID=A0A399F8B3_9DEIN|nr:ABC transporter permease [Meiothermus granaticius]MCL6526470.1 ABC transporter permease [Thermaceae bacterium]RIH92907.1 Glutathione transport system permease protein GsiC [Meiothermus granaticius NBRC 107808]GEM86763.1 ABC transporter permease [Meiothermus granaticius NBRC 107808]
MISYFLKRLLDLIVVMFGVSLVVFLMIRLIPGDAVEIMLGANTEITPERLNALRDKLGLNQPLLVQYGHWLGQALRGNLGQSVWTGTPVTQEIVQRLPLTLELTLLSLGIGLLFAIPVGILTAYWRNSLAEMLIRILSITGVTLPSFWLGTLFIFLAFKLAPAWPTLGYVPFSENPIGHLQRIILPVLTLALPLLAGLSRLLRSSLLDLLNQDFIRTARAKGLSERTVVYKHALKNALIPLVTVVGIQVGYLFGGAIVVEQVFALPGMGRLIVGAINERNYPLVQGSILLITTIFVLINLLVDLLYARLDPRVEYA